MNYSKVLSLLILSILSIQSVVSQDITWANKLLEKTDRYQQENNGVEMVLGVPTVYPSKLEEQIDPYTEGYVAYYENAAKKNSIKVGFPGAILARQVVIGGIFNIGSINSIKVIDSDLKEKIVYQLDQKPSKTKFTTFSAFFPQTKVTEVVIEINHANINEWNLIKGIGLTFVDSPIDLRPTIVPQDEFNVKEKVGGNISSKDCYEFSPKLSPDGKTLFFVKECPGQPDQDIWFSELNEKGQWTEARNVGAPLNNKGHNFVASASMDGRFLILGNTYNEDGSDAGDGVSISYKKEDGSWGVPQSLKIPNFKNLNSHANFFMSSDEQVLLLAIQDDKSNGDLDLYATFYNKYSQVWSEPLNLGNAINSPFAEDYPYLAPDGKTLYFSSKGYMGYGGHDIYMAKRLDNTWKKWSKPINLGPMVNSKTDDKGFTIAAHGNHAYYNTVNFDVDSVHQMDIYKVNLPKILKQNPQVLLSGRLQHISDKSGIRGTIRVKNNEGELISFCTSNPKTGKYALSVPFGQVYDLRIDAINCFTREEKLSVKDSSKGIDITVDFALTPYLDSGYVITFDNILFEKGKDKLLTTAGLVLDKLVEQLRQQTDARIEIGGHTDSKGDAKTNLKLSTDRAKAVYDYLIANDIAEKRLSYKGYGASVPIADNNTDEGRKKNRRVTVTYLSKLIKE